MTNSSMSTSRAPYRLFDCVPALAVVLTLLTLAGCEMLAGWMGPPPPPTSEVEGWKDLQIILGKIEARVGDQAEIDAIQVELADPDGDKMMPLGVLSALVEPQPWAEGFEDPFAFYIALCLEDPALSPAGLESRKLSVGQLRDSIKGILAD